MTDQEITRRLAEKVMGWAIVNGSIHTEGETAWTGRRLSDFEPLNDPRACGEVMNALRAKGLYWQLTAMEDGTCRCNLYRSDGIDVARPRIYESTWTRALCLATVRATGGEV